MCSWRTTRSPTGVDRNNKNGTFTDIAVSAGVAFSEDGVAPGGHGRGRADYDESGRASLAVGNFSNQMLGLDHNEGNGLFVDEAPRWTISPARACLSLRLGRSSSTTTSTPWPGRFVGGQWAY
jgi:hypothetical protein